MHNQVMSLTPPLVLPGIYAERESTAVFNDIGNLFIHDTLPMLNPLLYVLLDDLATADIRTWRVFFSPAICAATLVHSKWLEIFEDMGTSGTRAQAHITGGG